MFKMRNAVGSAIIIAKNERRRDELLKRGFTLVEEKKAVKAKTKEVKE